MRREEIRAFIKAGVDALSPSVKFNSGRISEFNSARDNEYPFVWLESLRATNPSEAPQQVWECVLHIAKLDKIDSKPEEYEALLDDCDYLAQLLIMSYRNTITGWDKLVIGDSAREPMIKKHADDVTKIVLSFEITDFNPVDVC